MECPHKPKHPRVSDSAKAHTFHAQKKKKIICIIQVVQDWRNVPRLVLIIAKHLKTCWWKPVLSYPEGFTPTKPNTGLTQNCAAPE